MDNKPTFNLAKQAFGKDTYYLDLNPENIKSIALAEFNKKVVKVDRFGDSPDFVTCSSEHEAVELAQKLSNQLFFAKMAKAIHNAEDLYDEPTLTGEALLMVGVAIIVLAIAVKVIFF